MGFKYETHLHTMQGSACGRMTGRDHVQYYRDIGYTGIIVTDHFYRGNTAANRDLPWREWVNQYCSGYEDALNEGIKLGLDVFFGWEETFHGDDYLVYGLDKEWLLEHPEVRTWTHAEQYRTVHENGGCVIQAHPFRVRDYIHRIHLNNRFVDGVEVANAGNDALFDAYAMHYAQKLGFYMTAGSDNHHSGEGNYEKGIIYGVETQKRLTCIGDYVDLILNKDQVGLLYAAGRFDAVPSEHPLPLDAFFVEEDESLTPVPDDWFNT